MKLKNNLVPCLAIAAVLLALPGCSGCQSPQLANEISFPLDGIADITISYDEEPVTIYASEHDELTIKEYMTTNKSSYYAKVTQDSDSIKVSEGGKPFFKSGFSRYIEVYCPASYQESLTITTTDGDIDFADPVLSLNTLRIHSTADTVRLGTAEVQTVHLSTTSGNFEAGCLDADTIGIDTTSGNFSCEKLDGAVTYTTTSGNADIQSAIGSGAYTVNHSGNLSVSYAEVTGDLTFFNKNDSIRIMLPEDLEFEFQATTKNGSVATNFQECVSTDDKITSGTIGDHPTVTLTAETTNGTIEVMQ